MILTNPDMLHMGVLPNHKVWGTFMANLAFVVIDEAHVYRGVFGSHVANVLRRLRRIAAAYGTEPRLLFTSATIANPVELAERLSGLDDVALVDRDGAPGSRRQIAMWNPPVIDEALQTRRSALGEAADVIAELVRGGSRTICFVKSRRGVELVAKIAADLRERRYAAGDAMTSEDQGGVAFFLIGEGAADVGPFRENVGPSRVLATHRCAVRFGQSIAAAKARDAAAREGLGRFGGPAAILGDATPDAGGLVESGDVLRPVRARHAHASVARATRSNFPATAS